MTFQQFVKKVHTALQDYYGGNVILEKQKFTKNNGVELTGLMFRKHGSDVAPIIYLDPLYDKYQEGLPMSEVVRTIIRVYEENKENRGMEMDFFNHYEEVKKLLSCRLINKEQNQIRKINCNVNLFVYMYSKIISFVKLNSTCINQSK